MTADAESYRDYTRRRRLSRVVWMAALPTAVIVLAFGARTASWAVGMLWIVARIMAALHFEGWPCPRCGKAFFRKGAWHNSFARRCMNCDFPMPAPADAASGPAE